MAFQITRESDYAVRCLLYLRDNADKYSSVGDISDSMGIPKTFTSKILQKLSRAGLVKSVRGVGGGFSLSRRPEDISLLDVIEAVEGRVSLNICVLDKKSCDRVDKCAVHNVWVKLREEFAGMLSRHNFKNIDNGVPLRGRKKNFRRRV